MGRKPNNPNPINSTQSAVPITPVVQLVDPNQLTLPGTEKALSEVTEVKNEAQTNVEKSNDTLNKILDDIKQTGKEIEQDKIELRPIAKTWIDNKGNHLGITTMFMKTDKDSKPALLGASIDSVTQSIKTFKRDSNGLVEGVTYKYLEDGRIDWRAMIKPEHLVVFKEKREEVEKKYGKPISELDLTTIEDKYLLILLIGLKELAARRGFSSVIPHVDEANSQRCVVTTTIKWIPNFETNFEYVEFGDVGAASLENTYSFGQRYLEACASNRAFARAVRNFLGINIVAFDEIGGFNKDGNGNIDNDDKSTSSLSSGYKPHNLLEQKVDSKGLNFAKFRDAVVLKYKNEIKSDPTKWESYISIPPTDIYVLLGILEKSKN